MQGRRLASLAGAASLLLALALPGASTAATFDWLDQGGYSGGQAGKFITLNTLGADASGNLLYSDGQSRIQKVDEDGNPIWVAGWGVNDTSNEFQVCTTYCAPGIQGSGVAQLNAPYGIDTTSSGDIYVVDYTNSRVLRFEPDGSYVSSFGSNGSGDGQFLFPVGLAIDSNDDIYVVDQGNDRIQKFDEDGNFLLEFGTSGTGDGEFDGANGIAVNSSDDVYVVDSGNDRVQAFDSTGTYQSQIGGTGSGDGQFENPQFVAIDPSNNLYVSDDANDRVQKFNSSNTYLTQWALDQAAAITFANGSVYVVGDAGSLKATTRYSPTGVEEDSLIGSYRGVDPGELVLPSAVAVDSDGNAYVADAGTNFISVYSPDYTFQQRWGGSGSGPGQFNTPFGLAVHGDHVLVADSLNQRVQVLTKSGVFVDQFNGADAPSGPFQGVVAIDTDTAGNIYVADAGTETVQKYSPNFEFITEWGSLGSGPGEFQDPFGVAVDQNGFVYVADRNNGRVQKFTSNGTYVTEWSTGLVVPRTVATDLDNNVYVGDLDQNNVHVFTSDGTPIQQFGAEGLYKVQFDDIGQIAVDCAGNVHVPDSESAARVQKIGDPAAGSPVCASDNGGGGNNGGGGGGNATVPRLTGLAMSPSRFRTAGRCKKAKRGKRKCKSSGSSVSYSLSEAAKVTLSVDLRVKGKRVGNKCRRVTKRNRSKLRKRRSCVSYVRRFSFDKDSTAGKTSIPFSGKYGKRTLRPGIYRLSAVAKGSNDNQSAPASTLFRILKR